jgi:glycosyltransferase involved in cell wall biosynthesis
VRIAFTNWSNRLVGGAEQYLDAVAGVLAEHGHQLSLWHQIGTPEDRPVVGATLEFPSWDASRLGWNESIEQLRRWRPDVVYCQGMLDPTAEERTQVVAPSVFFAHNYHGTCISGGKTMTLPVVRPCTRRLGPACLLLYYPCRCGGLSPVTMWRDYGINSRRLRALARYDRVITHSAHMMEEYTRHGINCRQVRFFAPRDPMASPHCAGWTPGERWNLLMMGRMIGLKGGETLLEALPLAAARLRRPLTVRLAGDGPARARWEAKAEKIRRQCPELEIHFPGWLAGEERDRAMRNADVMLAPSLWPEPFGLIGLEAGQWSVPSVAFAVGGIPSWLEDGVNGCLASASPASPASFADALVKCLADEDRYRQMRSGAQATTERMSAEAHYEDLMKVFEETLESPGSGERRIQ